MTDRDRSFSALERRLWHFGYVSPVFPVSAQDNLEVEDGSTSVVTRGLDLDPFAGYGLQFADGRGFGRSKVHLERFLQCQDAYFVSAGRSNGNSEQWGFAAGSGQLFVSLQTTLGTLGGSIAHRLRFNRIVCAYNDLLASYLVDQTQVPSVAVLHSDYRGYSMILSTDADRCVAMGADIKWFSSFRIPDEWGLVMAFNRFGSMLGANHRDLGRIGDNRCIKAAISFLRIVNREKDLAGTHASQAFLFVDRRNLNFAPLTITKTRDEVAIFARRSWIDIGHEVAAKLRDRAVEDFDPDYLTGVLDGYHMLSRPNVDITTIHVTRQARRLGGTGHLQGLLHLN